MKVIEHILRQQYGLKVDDEGDHLYAEGDTIVALVVAPHKGNNNRYLVRFSARADFDRWANSTVIEKSFASVGRVCKYLQTNQVAIYQELLKHLHAEYIDISTRYMWR